MEVSKITSFTSVGNPNLANNKKVKKDFLAQFHEKTKNSADMTDTIVVPRTIFKGYLGIMAGTTLLSLCSFLKKPAFFSKFLSVSGLLTSMYGTYAFVRPFIIKDAKGVEKGK